LLQVLKSHSDVEPVEKRRPGDAGVGKNAPKSGTTVGEGGQRRVLGAPDSVEAPVDQHFDIRCGFGDGTENLTTTGFRVDIADAHLQMPLAVLTAPSEGGIQGHDNRGRHRFRRGRGTVLEHFTDFQGMTAHCPRVLRTIDREHLLQKIAASL
jgi:hypothetical protein